MKHNIQFDSERFNRIMARVWTPIAALLLLFMLSLYVVKIEGFPSDPLWWLGLLMIALILVGLWLVFPGWIINTLLVSYKNDPLLKRWDHPWLALIFVGAAIAILYLAV